jgi:hypothetical protein
VPDSEDDEEEQDHDDDGVQVVGEFPSAPRPAGRGRPRSGSRSKQQQRGVRTAGQRAAAVQQQQAEAVTPGAPAGAGDAEDEDDNSSWRVLHLPQVRQRPHSCTVHPKICRCCGPNTMHDPACTCVAVPTCTTHIAAARQALPTPCFCPPGPPPSQHPTVLHACAALLACRAAG